MIVTIRIRLKNDVIGTMEAILPDDLKDNSEDTLNDAVSDWLDENSIKYKWYRVLLLPTT